MSARSFFGLFTLLTFFVGGAAIAQKPVSLPLGDLVAFSGAECGQIGDTWEAGVILGNGKFVSLSAQISKLKKKKRKAKLAGNTKKAASLGKQIKGLNSRIVTDASICLGFDIGVVRPTTPQQPDPAATQILWSEDVFSSGLTEGQQALFFCPPNGNFASIWGAFTYTSDSSVCYAAVHTGLINLANGGNVRIVYKAGQPRYVGSLRNGIESSSYPSFTGSFAFVHPSTGQEIAPNVPLVYPFSAGLTTFRSELGLELSLLCPANGTEQTIWGTDIYTDDSEVCAAAVHAGKTSFLRGGVVKAVIAGAQTSFLGSARNGVQSSDYGSWPGSYSFN